MLKSPLIILQETLSSLYFIDNRTDLVNCSGGLGFLNTNEQKRCKFSRYLILIEFKELKLPFKQRTPLSV